MSFELQQQTPGAGSGRLLLQRSKQARGCCAADLLAALPAVPPPGVSPSSFVPRGSAARLRSSHSSRRQQQQQRASRQAPAGGMPASVSVATAPTALLQLPRLHRGQAQLVAGGLAGAVSKTLVAPLDRVATIIAVASGRRMSVEKAVQAAWRDGGVAGLWRGNGLTILKIFPASAVNFAVFHSMKDLLLSRKVAAAAAAASSSSSSGSSQPPLQHLGTGDRLLAGAAAGAASVCVTHPLETLRTLMAVAGGIQGNMLQVTTRVLRSHGPAGLYKGFRCSLVNDMLGNAVGFSLYELGCRVYEETYGTGSIPPTVRGVIGSLAAACTLTVTCPLEVARRRLQVQGTAGRPLLYRGTVDCLRTIARDEGLAGFYGASLPLYLKVAPSIGMMYMLHHVLSQRLAGGPQPQPAAQAALAQTEA